MAYYARFAYLAMLAALIPLLAGCPAGGLSGGLNYQITILENHRNDFGFPGPHAWKSFNQKLEDGSYATVYYPDTNPPLRHQPLIVFNTGWNQVRGAYQTYCIQLAQWGYPTILRFYPSLGTSGVIGNDFVPEAMGQAIACIDWMETANNDPDSPLFGMVDTHNVGVAGHSMGGIVSVITPLFDDRIRASVSMDGRYADPFTKQYSGWEELDVPFLYIGGGDGGWCSASPVAEFDFYERCNPPSLALNITGADHMSFIEEGCGALCMFGNFGCPEGWANPAYVRGIAQRYMTAWFNVYLRGDSSYQRFLDGDAALQDEANGTVVFERKN